MNAGNAGTTEQHYDFNSGLRRRKDLALLWAESAYRHDECVAYAVDSPFRQTCLDNASGTFISKYEQNNGFGSFDATTKRIVDWVNINQELGDIAIPGDGLSIYFSDGIKKHTQLCTDMIADYRVGANAEPEPSVCSYNVNGTNTPTDDPNSLDRKFQILMLSGVLPNREDIGGSIPMSGLYPKRLRPLSPSESKHYDHFHLKVQQ